MSMSDAAGALFNFRRKNKDEDDTAPHVSTGDIPQVFAPTPTGAVPRHAACWRLSARPRPSGSSRLRAGARS